MFISSLFSAGNKTYMMGNETSMISVPVLPSKPAGLFQSKLTQVSRYVIPTSFIKIDSAEPKLS